MYSEFLNQKLDTKCLQNNFLLKTKKLFLPLKMLTEVNPPHHAEGLVDPKVLATFFGF
jgi:hypothetical protein